MGFREKITLTFIVLVILQMTVNCLRLPQKYENRAKTRSNGVLRKHPSKYIPLQQTQNIENYSGSPKIYGNSIRKYVMFKPKCFQNYQYQKYLNTKNSLSTQEQGYKSHDLFSTCNKKNIIKKSINSNEKNEQSAPVLFYDLLPAPSYRDIFHFPDVEYPLCASETWKPYYFNSFLTDTPTNNLYCVDKTLKRSEEKPRNFLESFGNIRKSNKITSSYGFNKASEKLTMIDKNLNATLEPKQIPLNVTSYYDSNTTNIKTCESTLRNDDKGFIVLSRPEDCDISLLDRENQFGLDNEDYTTDDPEYEESSPFAQSTVAPPILTSNDLTWENTKVVEKYIPDLGELNNYFISV